MGFSGAGMEEEYYGSRDVQEDVFGGANTIQKMMDVEAALAWAECEVGLVPEQYAGEIQKKCSVELLDEAVYAEARRTTRTPAYGDAAGVQGYLQQRSGGVHTLRGHHPGHIRHGPDPAAAGGLGHCGG